MINLTEFDNMPGIHKP